MVGMVQENLVCRIFDSILLLQTVPAAQRNISTAEHRVSSDVDVLFNNEHGNAMIPGRNRGA